MNKRDKQIIVLMYRFIVVLISRGTINKIHYKLYDEVNEEISKWLNE